jgi:putative ABC transport system ATP-binding protein
MLIEANKLCKEYGCGESRIKALENINLTVSEGDFLAIMGPSGSGKIDAYEYTRCLDKPTSGRYLICGEEPRRLSEFKLAKLRSAVIGFVFQSFFLLPKLTVEENIEIPLLYTSISKSKRKKIVWDMLSRMGLKDRAAHLPSQISGGQRQRVAIGRALVNTRRFF